MKTRFLLLIAGLCFGCSGFLEEVDNDKLVPTKTEHYAATLLNTTYLYAGYVRIEYMTDNLTEYGYSQEAPRLTKKPEYTWQAEIDLDENGLKRTGSNDAWLGFYKNIAVINYTIEFIDTAIGTQEERDYIKGEAYFLRAKQYFYLLNLYGVPYNAATCNMDLGVPLRIDNKIQQHFDRNTVAECYARIESDLKEAIRLITLSGVTKSKYHPSVTACQLLLSRVYLYQGNTRLNDAVDAATEVITRCGKPLPLLASGLILTPTNTEMIYWAKTGPLLLERHFEEGWKASDDLMALYANGDLRKTAYFTQIGNKVGDVYYSRKQETSYTSVGAYGMRLTEAYLNRAEAYAKSNRAELARADMKALLDTRYSGGTYTIPAEDAQLLDFILAERRKEFCFEDHHRWFDLRRMENRPTIVHVYTKTNSDGTILGREIYRLLPDDPNYTLPIPISERENNPLIRNNERFDKMPETEIDF